MLQQGQPVPVWGTVAPDESVTVDFAGQKKTAVADAQGRWKVTLDPMPASAEPRSLKISSSLNPRPSRLKDGVLEVAAPEVAKPVALRYAFLNFPECTLYNGAGLPALPFRTDDWPVGNTEN